MNKISFYFLILINIFSFSCLSAKAEMYRLVFTKTNGGVHLLCNNGSPNNTAIIFHKGIVGGRGKMRLRPSSSYRNHSSFKLTNEAQNNKWFPVTTKDPIMKNNIYTNIFDGCQGRSMSESTSRRLMNNYFKYCMDNGLINPTKRYCF